MAKKRRSVIIVGAGAAGIGTAVVLDRLGIDVLVIDRNEIGASFSHWPKEMRFITSHQQVSSSSNTAFVAIELHMDILLQILRLTVRAATNSLGFGDDDGKRPLRLVE